ncbi:hypothetical protein Tco_0770139 [Tanacetum coccineum]|uniref:Uncharacterized protein n=1 Tax=Tanacetum coccineum TaxID=301880 RepID=A0ABQ4ZF77_9ASTR
MTELPKSQPKKTYEEDLESEIVMIKMPSCMSFLGCTNAYDEPICNLDKMEDKVENPSPQSTPQVLPSFEEYTPPVTYPEEVKETLGTPMKVEPLDQMKLEDVGLNNHSIPISYKEVLIFDEPEPLPQSLPNFPFVDTLETASGFFLTASLAQLRLYLMRSSFGVLRTFGKLLEEIHVTWTQFGKKMGQDYNFTRSGFKDARIVPRDGVAIPSDAVRTYKRRRQDLCDDVRT